LITHLDDDVDKHPHGDEDADEGHRQDGQRPRPADERLVRVDRNLSVELLFAVVNFTYL